MYREYDCYDPLARAPTPLPPMVLEQDEDEVGIQDATEESVQTLEASNNAIPWKPEVSKMDTPLSNLDCEALSVFEARTPEDTHHLLPPSVADSKRAAMNQADELPGISQDVLFPELPDIGVLATSIASVSKQVGAEITVKEDQKLYEASSPMKEGTNNVMMPDTPPDSPTKTALDLQTTSPTSTISTLSTLSPVPSNLSDQDETVSTEVRTLESLRVRTTNFSQIKGASTTLQKFPNQPSTPSKSPQTTTKTKTTRGVAQKVKRFDRVSKSSPAKRKVDSVEDLTLRELHAGAFVRTGGRRRSVRQAQSQDA